VRIPHRDAWLEMCAIVCGADRAISYADLTYTTGAATETTRGADSSFEDLAAIDKSQPLTPSDMQGKWLGSGSSQKPGMDVLQHDLRGPRHGREVGSRPRTPPCLTQTQE
jgi:hypothetical protein